MSSEGRRAADRLLEVVGSLGRAELLVVTGAGISHASGIPTFRGSDPGAVWSRDDVETATFDFFRRDPVGQWRWYLDRFESIDRARPNPAHRALVDIEAEIHRRGGRFTLVTQNIDTLHRAAGSADVIEVHGRSDRLRCSAAGRCALAAPAGSIARRDVDLESFRAEPSPEHLPRCPECGAFLRAHVLFFDEYYDAHLDYRFDEVRRAATGSEAVLFVGTSLSVGVTDLVLRAGARLRRPMLSIDPAGDSVSLSSTGLETLRQPAELALPRLAHDLEARAV